MKIMIGLSDSPHIHFLLILGMFSSKTTH